MLKTTTNLTEGTKAVYKGDKIEATHVEKVDHILQANAEDRKDSNNGFTRDRSMRLIGRVPYIALLDFDKKHPGWLKAVSVATDRNLRNRLWRAFLESEQRYMTVGSLKTK